MNPPDIEVIERRSAYRGYGGIDLYRLRHRRHDGGWSPTLSREVYHRGHVAAVLPYDPIADRVVLLEQFRVGAFVAGAPAWQIEIVAGMIDREETPEAVARREAIEEAGCDVTELWPIQRYLVSPGAITETVELYLGRVDSRNVGGIHGLAAEGEDIKVSTAAVDELPVLLAGGKIGNAMTLIALQWLLLHREDVRAKWGAA